ncbi:hypothetical protein KKF84_01305 [Myxococcota bacterium]|nr:hypothetical protein [Myxococcota bacterium]MBU1533921.1 hypothetical protein [Myxococcota bacterium]
MVITLLPWIISLGIAGHHPDLERLTKSTKPVPAGRARTQNGRVLYMDQFKGIKQLGSWRKDYFNRWIGGESSKLYVTFPEVMTSGSQKTYAGFWANKMTTGDGERTLLIRGDYEFTYYKFTGYDANRNRSVYKFYKLRINGESKLAEDSQARFLIRDLEVQQSNFEQNFARTTLALGYYHLLLNTKKTALAVTVYAGGAIQANLASEIPGMEDLPMSPSGISSTTGIEFKFMFHRFIGYIKYQFSFFDPDSLFNRTTVRLSIQHLVFPDDYIWVQIDTQFPTGSNLLIGNMFFVSYLKKF